MKATLFSTDKSSYPDIEVDFKEIDAKSYVEESIQNGVEPQTANKTATVSARKINKEDVGTVVETRPFLEYEGKKYSIIETGQSITEEKIGSWIVTNPDGEQYIVKPDKFDSRYTPTEREGVFESHGSVTVITTPENVVFSAPWGEKQWLTRGGAIAINPNDLSDVYGITNSAFKATYTLQDKKANAEQNEAAPQM